MNTNSITAKSQKVLNPRMATDTLLVAGGGIVGGLVATLTPEALELGNDTAHASTTQYEAENKHTAPSATEDSIVLTTSPSVSFEEAFAHARAELGAGGIFEWQGKLYNTYFESEWEAMPQAEKQQFVAGSVAKMNQPSNTSSELLADNEHMNTITPVDEVELDDEDDVRILGVFDAPIGEHHAQVAVLSHDDKHAFFIDLNRDGHPDLFASDVDGDHQLSETEIIPVNEDGSPIAYAMEETMEDPMAGIQDDTQYFSI